jgi:sulfate transport system substrate-binding protein
LTLFELGTGDALITYEQDALLARDRGVPLEIVLPPRTIVAQHTAVVVTANAGAREKAAAEDFVNYLLSETGQSMLVRYHMRPAAIDSESFGQIDQPFTVEELGGWPQAHDELIEGIWKQQIAPQLEARLLPKVVNGED